MPVLAWITIALVIGLCYAIRQNRKLSRKYREAVNSARNSLMMCELLELKIAIIRYARDCGALPTTMDELRGGHDQGHDFINPFRGEDYVIDLTFKHHKSVPAHSITFEYIVPDGPGSERCVIRISGADGSPRHSSMIFIQKKLVTS